MEYHFLKPIDTGGQRYDLFSLRLQSGGTSKSNGCSGKNKSRAFRRIWTGRALRACSPHDPGSCLLYTSIDVKQKGVDMRIGVDISSLAFKNQVDRIILIAGDSDFVPASKQARREGIDFILDPMRAPIKDDLFEHIDGMRTKAPCLLYTSRCV